MNFTPENLNKGSRLIQTLIEKSWESETFKAQFVNNPEIAIENFIGKSMTIPSGKSIKVDDQTDTNVIYINIPRQVSVDELELSEEQLDTVSGGFIDPVSVATYVGIAVGVAQICDWVGQGWNSVK